MTHTGRSASEWPALLKWAATGDTSVIASSEWCQVCGHSFLCQVLVRTHPHNGDHTSCILSSKRYCWFYTKCVFFDGVGFANYFASKHTCGLQYGAGLATASTTWRIVRCLIHTRRQSCVYEQMFKIFRESEGNYGVIWWHLVVWAKKFMLRWYVTTSGMSCSFLPRLPRNKLSSLGPLIARWISMSSNSSGYPRFIRYSFNSWDCVMRLSCLEQILWSLKAWLKRIALLQCLGWKLFVSNLLLMFVRWFCI